MNRAQIRLRTADVCKLQFNSFEVFSIENSMLNEFYPGHMCLSFNRSVRTICYRLILRSVIRITMIVIFYNVFRIFAHRTMFCLHFQYLSQYHEYEIRSQEIIYLKISSQLIPNNSTGFA